MAARTVVLIALAAACNNNPAFVAPGTSVQHVAMLSDAQSAAVLGSLNAGEIKVAQAVILKLSSPDVRAFAQRMVDEHTALNEQTGRTLAPLNITPQVTSLTKALDSNAQQVVAELTGMTGAALDAAYMKSQVDMHEQALGMLDCVVLVSVQDGTLRQLVVGTVRPELIDHLAAAASLAASLSGAEASVGTADAGTAADGGTVVQSECSLACVPQSSGGLFPDEVRAVVCIGP
jgi:putative membrane protein